MYDRYNNYLEAPGHITFSELGAIYEDMLANISENDRDIHELWDIMLEAAISYADTRANWSRKTMDEKMAVDAIRTSEHNFFMNRLSDLADYIKGSGHSVAWFSKLGTIESNRKRFGDFACYIAFVHALNAR